MEPKRARWIITGRWRLPSDALRRAVTDSSALHGVLLRYVQTFMAQTAHTLLANTTRRLDERLARWLLMTRDRTGAADRLRREARIAARLQHGGIVSVFDAGEEDGSRFLVSELVRGATLAQLEAAGATVEIK